MFKKIDKKELITLLVLLSFFIICTYLFDIGTSRWVFIGASFVPLFRLFKDYFDQEDEN